MKIAAFNVQKFGKNKLSDPEVLNILVKVTHKHTHGAAVSPSERGLVELPDPFIINP